MSGRFIWRHLSLNPSENMNRIVFVTFIPSPFCKSSYTAVKEQTHRLFHASGVRVVEILDSATQQEYRA
jgi:hypothetical protein